MSLLPTGCAGSQEGDGQAAEEGRQVRAYLCNGLSVNEWFTGSAEGNDLDLTSEGGGRLEGNPAPESSTGTLSDGKSFTFTATTVLRSCPKVGDPEALEGSLEGLGVLGQTLEVMGFTPEEAPEVARLRPSTKALGLSLGDRACGADPVFMFDPPTGVAHVSCATDLDPTPHKDDANYAFTAEGKPLKARGGEAGPNRQTPTALSSLE